MPDHAARHGDGRQIELRESRKEGGNEVNLVVDRSIKSAKRNVCLSGNVPASRGSNGSKISLKIGIYFSSNKPNSPQCHCSKINKQVRQISQIWFRTPQLIKVFQSAGPQWSEHCKIFFSPSCWKFPSTPAHCTIVEYTRIVVSQSCLSAPAHSPTIVKFF